MDTQKERVLWVGNLAELVTEDLLYELFTQAGPVESVKIIKDRSDSSRRFAFITFKHEESVPYTIALMDGIHLFGKILRLQKRSGTDNDSNPYLKALYRYKSDFHSTEQSQRRYVSDEKRSCKDRRDNRYTGHRERQKSYEEEKGQDKHSRSKSYDESKSARESSNLQLIELPTSVNSQQYENSSSYAIKNQFQLQEESRRQQQFQQEHMKMLFYQNMCNSITVPSSGIHPITYFQYNGNR